MPKRVFVVLVAAATVLVLLSWPDTGVKAQEALAPYRIGYVGQAPALDRDIFSADSAGAGQRDASNRPGLNETDPAYSPDGARLAYTEFGETGSRVVLAAADGSNPVPLGTLAAGESERDPAWSPDGTLIALTHLSPNADGTTSTVRIVRVADGQPVGQVPMPPQLQGDDLAPVWSPDGTRIAFTRKATQAPANVVPPVVDRPARQGSSFTVDKTVHTQQVPAEPDVLLLVDGTGSLSDVIDQVRANLATVVGQVREREPSAHFGVAVFRDVVDGADRLFHVEAQPIPVDTPEQLTQLQDALGRIDANGGGDVPEDWINALHEISTGAVAFRPDSSRVVVLVGDAPSHDPSNGHRLTDVANELRAQQVRVVGIPVGAGNLDSARQASAVAAATNGIVMPATPDPANVADTIVAGIGSLNVTVAPVVTQCDSGLSATFDPPGPATVPGGQDAKFTETVHIGADAAVGSTLHCTVEFRLNGENAVRAGYTESITVQVTDSQSPLVIVAPIDVEASTPLGSVVVYTVIALDLSGNPLLALCTRASGSLFSIGVTAVVCTATDSAGRTGSGSAPIVVEPPGESTEHVWLAGVSRPTPDSVGIGDQVDLSARLAAPCAGGRDGAPDWAPDGASLAFQHDDAICVAAADGSGARQVVGDTGRVYRDPVFSPDGKLIAVTGYRTESPGTIFTVPVAGGAATSLIAPPGGAEQAAFLRLPELAVTASATPASIDFGGSAVVEFTVTNHGSASVADAELSTVLPAGLRAGQVQSTRGSCAGSVCAIGPVAPGESVVVRIGVTAVVAGEEIVRATVHTSHPFAADNTASVTVTVAAQPTQLPGGTLSVTATANPNPAAYVGGDDLVMVYTISNGSAAVTPAVAVAITLPTTLPAAKSITPAGCTVTGCSLGDLQPGQTVEVRLDFPATVAVNDTTSATVTSSGTSVTTTAPIVVRQPTLTVDPTAGPQGFVTRVLGTGLPPGAAVKLTWSTGISQAPGLVVVGPDGTLDAQMLVFHHDQLGPRTLIATPASGPAFGPVSSPEFDVQPRSLQPPLFVARN